MGYILVGVAIVACVGIVYPLLRKTVGILRLAGLHLQLLPIMNKR